MKLTKIILGILILMPITHVLYAKFAVMHPQMVPIQRLIQNTEELLKQQKDSQQLRLYYVLGRLHSMAYAFGEKDIGAVTYFDIKTQKKTNYYLPYWGPMEFSGSPNPQQKILPISSDEKRKRLAHLKKAIAAYKKSLSLNPNDSFSVLGLAWCLEEDNQIDKAIDAYQKAFEFLYRDIFQGRHLEGWGGSATKEAAEAYLKLVKKKKGFLSYFIEKVKMERKFKDFKKAPRGYITPVVFPLKADDENVLASELAFKNENVVLFDISGLGVKQSVRWLPQNWAFLVWDPENKKNIHSGKQLFGSITWWIFWDNGYQPLFLLDDNRDGWLKGKELDGIFVWRDVNQDGISQPSEVQSLSSYGIVAIKTKFEATKEGMPFCKNGLLLSDNSYLPTYDWKPKVNATVSRLSLK